MHVFDWGRTPLTSLSRTPLVRAVWARLVQWQFRLFHRHRHRHIVLEQVADRPILVLPDVFNPTLFKTGEFLATLLDSRLIPPNSAVLDMGTGTGIAAIFAASWAAHVVAVDINPAAVRCARINVLLNGVEEQVDVRHGDLFTPVAGQRFDVVLFNPPFFRGTPRDAFDHAWRSNDTVERFADGLGTHLTPAGYALVLLSTVGDTPAFLRTFRDHGFAISVVAEVDVFVETFTVYRLDQEGDIQ